DWRVGQVRNAHGQDFAGWPPTDCLSRLIFHTSASMASGLARCCGPRWCCMRYSRCYWPVPGLESDDSRESLNTVGRTVFKMPDDDARDNTMYGRESGQKQYDLLRISIA